MDELAGIATRYDALARTLGRSPSLRHRSIASNYRAAARALRVEASLTGGEYHHTSPTRPTSEAA